MKRNRLFPSLKHPHALAVAGVAAGLFILADFHAGEPQPAPVTANATNRFTITGMHCEGCARGLASELKRTRGVASASVTFSNRLAVVAFDTNLVTAAKLVKAAEEAGFQAKLATR